MHTELEHQNSPAPVGPSDLAFVVGIVAAAMLPDPASAARLAVAVALRRLAELGELPVAEHKAVEPAALPALVVAPHIPCSVALVHSSKILQFRRALLAWEVEAG